LSILGTPRHRRHGAHRSGDPARDARRDRSGSARGHRISSVAGAILIAVLTGCSSDPAPQAPAPQPAEENFTAIDSPSLQFLPRQEEAPGWRLEEDPIVVPADRLTSFLDLDAESLRRYEVLDATVGKYTSTAGAGFANVEIFRFPDFVKAFGAYSARKTAKSQFFELSNEAFQNQHSVNLWRGPFYVRVTGVGPGGLEPLKQLTASVAEKMPAAPAKPAVFNFFPTDVRVPNSERFSTRSGFGQTFLANSFQASFNAGGDVMEGLIIPAANKTAATRILDAYRALYVRNGKLLDPINNLGEDNFTAEDRYLGRAVAFRLDRFVIAFNGYKDRQKLVDLAIATDARILGQIRRQLVTAERQAERATQQPADQTPAWMRNR
jgi:hypothetical protein